MSIESEIRRIKENEDSKETFSIYYKGETRKEKVYEIPPHLLRFNYLNGRIGTEVIEYTQVNQEDLASMPIEDANNLIHNWIWSKSESDNKNTLKDIEEKHQIIPGVITRDGIVVDGNRRFMITRILNEKGLNRQFRAIILDDTYSDGGEKEFQLKRLEAEIQMGQDEKVKYSPIEPYLRIMDFVDTYINVESPKTNYEELTKIMSITSVKKAKTMYSIGKLMEEYLEYVGFNKIWSRLENTEDLFINLEKVVKLYQEGKGAIGRDLTTNEIYNFKTCGFDLIRWNYNSDKKEKGEWEAKKIREIYLKNSKDKTIFSNAKIWNEFFSEIDQCQDIKTLNIDQLVNEENLTYSEAAKKIDKDWANNVSAIVKSALGQAKSKLEDRQNQDQPEKFLADALNKLLNLIDEDLFESTSKIEINEDKLSILTEPSKIDLNLTKVDKIRRIAERLKRQLQ